MSTPTPPLRRRVVVLGAGVVALVLLAVNLAVYAALRASLLRSLDELLDERAASVRAEQAAVPPSAGAAADLARRLQARGLRVELRAPDGTVHRADPDSPVVSRELPPPVPGSDEFRSQEVPLRDGLTATVFARTSGVDRTLRQLLVLQVLSSLAALALAALLLGRAAALALRPVREIAAAATRTAEGQRGERLRPTLPDTELGQMATAYDAMLDALEAGMRVAANLERRGGTLETRWRQVLEASQAAYVAVDAQGRVADWNRRAEELFGWSQAEVQGRPATLLVPQDLRGALTTTVAELVARGPGAAVPPYELRALTRAGEQFDAECTVWGVDRRGGTVVHVFVRDVTLRHQAEETASRLAAVVQGSPDAILTQDLTGAVRSWNAAAERTYGWRVAEALDQPVSLVVPADQLPVHAQAADSVIGGGAAAAYEGEWQTRGGTRVPVAVRLSPVRDAQDRVVAVSSIAQDLTEQRFLAGTLDTTLAALAAALDEAQSSEERTRRFLADAAHQLRTPVAGIRACAETLLRGVPQESMDALLAAMVRETSRAARLVTSLLQVARLDAGEPMAPGPCDVADVCRDEVERARGLSPHLEVGLDADAVADADADAVAEVQCDAAALREVLANLLDNARRHAVSEVSVHLSRSEDGIQVRVADDGPGVPEPDRERVFERFVSLDGKRGSGLGLSIARGYARAMGGELRYEQGFVLTLPVGEPAGSDS